MNLAQLNMESSQSHEMPIGLHWDYNCLAMSEPDIHRFAADVKAAGFNQINFRLRNKGALNCRNVRGVVFHERLDAFGPAYDPLAILVQACREQGLKACVWWDLFDTWYDEFLIRYPEYTPQGRSGQGPCVGIASFCEPEVQAYYLHQLEDLMAYEPDSIFFCAKGSHTPQNISASSVSRNPDSGYNRPALERYRSVYGGDSGEYAGDEKAIDRHKLAEIHGSFLVDFFVAARRLLKPHGIRLVVGATTRQFISASPNLRVDWREIVERQAADAVCMCNSKHETDVWYSPEGHALFSTIRNACHEQGMLLYAYFMADLGMPLEVSNHRSMNGLVHHLPRQMRYYHALGADGVLIHDLDLVHKNRACRQLVWRSVGQWRKGFDNDQGKEAALLIPQAEPLEAAEDGVVPGGSFEGPTISNWYVVPSWLTDERSGLGNVGFNYHGEEGSPVGWEPRGNEHPRLVAEYDRKVLHGEMNSGRTFYGRSALMLGVSPGAESLAGHFVSWNARCPISIVPKGPHRFRVWVHGEDLCGIESAGVHVDVFDSNDLVQSTWRGHCPLAGSFPWQALDVPCRLDSNSKYMTICLFLKMANSQTASGRLWFGQIEMICEDNSTDGRLAIARESGAYGGAQHAVFCGQPGLDMVSLPFHLNLEDKMEVQLAMRSAKPMPVTVVFERRHAQAEHGLWFDRYDVGSVRNDSKTFFVSLDWGLYSIPLSGGMSEAIARVMIRPHDEAELHVDAIDVCSCAQSFAVERLRS